MRLTFPMKTNRSNANRSHQKLNFEFHLSIDFGLFQTYFDITPNDAISISPVKIDPN